MIWNKRKYIYIVSKSVPQRLVKDAIETKPTIEQFRSEGDSFVWNPRHPLQCQCPSNGSFQEAKTGLFSSLSISLSCSLARSFLNAASKCSSLYVHHLSQAEPRDTISRLHGLGEPHGGVLTFQKPHLSERPRYRIFRILDSNMLS